VPEEWLVGITFRAVLSSLWYYWLQSGVRMIEELYTAVCFICPYPVPIPCSQNGGDVSSSSIIRTQSTTLWSHASYWGGSHKEPPKQNKINPYG